MVTNFEKLAGAARLPGNLLLRLRGDTLACSFVAGAAGPFPLSKAWKQFCCKQLMVTMKFCNTVSHFLVAFSLQVTAIFTLCTQGYSWVRYSSCHVMVNAACFLLCVCAFLSVLYFYQSTSCDHCCSGLSQLSEAGVPSSSADNDRMTCCP